MNPLQRNGAERRKGSVTGIHIRIYSRDQIHRDAQNLGMVRIICPRARDHIL